MLTPSQQKAREHYRAGEAANARRDFATGVAECRKAIALRQDQGHMYSELANGLTLAHDYWLNPEQCKRMAADGTLEEAIRHWRRGIELGHQCPWARFSLGHALTAVGRPAEGAPHLRVAIDLMTKRDRPELAAAYDAAPVRGPDFLIIGSTKCGTTSLYEYLCKHPRILQAVWKEPEYFRFPELGLEWYLSHFPRTPTGYLTGEASSCYLSIWDAKTRVYEAFPKTKLIALVRDPVDKAISHCHHDRKLGCEARTVDVALNHELDILERLDDPFYQCDDYWKTEKGYVWLGLYAYMFDNWLSVFPKEQLLVIPSEDLWTRPAETVAQTLAFLGLPDHRLPNYEVHLEGKYDKAKPEPVRERLRRFYARHNERLFAQIGRRLDWQHP